MDLSESGIRDAACCGYWRSQLMGNVYVQKYFHGGANFKLRGNHLQNLLINTLYSISHPLIILFLLFSLCFPVSFFYVRNKQTYNKNKNKQTWTPPLGCRKLRKSLLHHATPQLTTPVHPLIYMFSFSQKITCNRVLAYLDVILAILCFLSSKHYVHVFLAEI